MTDRCQDEEDEEDDGEECAVADEVFDADPGPDDGAYAAQNAAQAQRGGRAGGGDAADQGDGGDQRDADELVASMVLELFAGFLRDSLMFLLQRAFLFGRGTFVGREARRGDWWWNGVVEERDSTEADGEAEEGGDGERIEQVCSSCRAILPCGLGRGALSEVPLAEGRCLQRGPV